MITRTANITSYISVLISAAAIALVACGGDLKSSAAGDVAPDSGEDATTDICFYPTANNDPACPPSYAYTLADEPCAPVGLRCMYPGAGDGESNGCNATAELVCTGVGGPDDRDAGEDGGREGTWIIGQ